MYRINLGFCFFLIAASLYAQDLNFTFFEAAPLQVNPALAGKIPHFQVSALYRNRWIGLDGFQTFYCGMDYHFDLAKSGAGLAVYNDRTARWKSTTAEVAYAQAVRVAKRWAISPGIKFSYTQRQIGYNGLIFGDQLQGGATQERLAASQFGFLGVSVGVLVYSKTFWLGMAAHQINMPDQSPGNTDSPLPIRMAFHAGLRIAKKYGKRLKDIARPAILAERQGGFAKIDMGSNFYRGSLFGGLWLRVLPYSIGQKMDAASLLVGYRQNGIRLAYSFGWDLTGIRGDAGTHEITLTAAPSRDRRKKKGKKWHSRIQCPFSALEGLND